MKKKLRPNVVRGGIAIPIGDNLYYMQGRRHEQGGIDIGSNPRTGLEVEGGELVQMTPKSMKVFSSMPFLYGESPANLVMSGADPNTVFNAQESFKDRNRLNDDGTKKKRIGGDERIDSLMNYVFSKPRNFVERAKNPNRKYIQDWTNPSNIATHKLSADYDDYYNAVVYPEVQEIDGELVDFTRPPYYFMSGLDNAIERGDTVRVKTLEDAIDVTTNYKNYFPEFRTGGNRRIKKARNGILERIKNKVSNIYWHQLRAPKDYTDDVATLRNGTVTEECAKWANDALQAQGLSVFGDAWTRSSNKNLKKIYSGYNVKNRPKEYMKTK